MVSSWARKALVIDETEPTATPPGRARVASPYGARLSITTSATSDSRRPLGCFGPTCAVCWSEVTAMTSWPFSLASRARPTTDPLTPELEAMTKTSPGWIGEISHNSAMMSGSRSRLDPLSASTGPARDLHRKCLGVARPERLNHRTGLDRPGHQTDRGVQAPVGGQGDQVVESPAHLTPEIGHRGNRAPRHRLASSRTAVLLPSGSPPGTEAAVRGGMRRGRRWEETASADAASFALDRSKFACATNR